MNSAQKYNDDYSSKHVSEVFCHYRDENNEDNKENKEQGIDRKGEGSLDIFDALNIDKDQEQEELCQAIPPCAVDAQHNQAIALDIYLCEGLRDSIDRSCRG